MDAGNLNKKIIHKLIIRIDLAIHRLKDTQNPKDIRINGRIISHWSANAL